MAEIVNLADLANLSNDGTAIAAINSNNTIIEEAFLDCLSLAGRQPNAMQSNLDMNNNQILNLPSPATVNSPVRLRDVPAGTGVPIASVPPVGTSGAVVPLLNGNNTWSGTNNFTAATTLSSVTGATNFTGPVLINNVSTTVGTLFSTTGYGEPNTKSGLFTSGAGPDFGCRYIATYFAHTILYGATTKDSTIGETGFDITFTTGTGYQPLSSGGGEKAAMQISAFGTSGGGHLWAAAMSANFFSGWAGASGNFGVGLEIDTVNNAANAIGTSTIISGLWLSAQTSLFPITQYLDISGGDNTGHVYGAGNGITFEGGQYAIKNYTIVDFTQSAVSYNDAGTHNVGINLGGTYSTFQIAGTGWAVGTDGTLTSAALNGFSGGPVKFTSTSFSSNAAIATALSSVGPTGSHTTVQEWLTVKNGSGVTRYIPCF